MAPRNRRSGLRIKFNTPKEAEIQSKQVLDLTIDTIKSQLPDPNNPVEIGQAILEFALDKNPYTAIGRRMVGQGLKQLTTRAGKPAKNVTRKLTGSQINAAITPEGVLNRYGVYKTVKGKRVRVPLDDELPYSPGRKDQHHWIPKDVRYDFTQQAQKLDPKGKAQLDVIDAEYDLQAGGGSKGLITMDMMAHLPFHGRIRGAGYEVSGKLLKEFREEIAGIKDIDQLKTVYRTWLEKNVIPTISTAQALQGGYEMLEAGGKKVSKEALLNAAYGRGGWMERQLDLVEHRIDTAIQDGRKPRKSDILFRTRAYQDALNNTIIQQ